MARNEVQQKVAQMIVDMHHSVNKHDFFIGAAEGIGMAISQESIDEDHAEEFARVFSVNGAWWAKRYMKSRKKS